MSEVNHFSDSDLPDIIDYVLITHNHQDHILFETLLPLRHKVKNIIVPRTNSGRLEDPDLKLMFNNIGFNNVFAIDEMEVIPFEDAVITGLPFIGEHSDLNIITKSCYLCRLGNLNCCFWPIQGLWSGFIQTHKETNWQCRCDVSWDGM